jgi:hypothetical protein
MSIQSSRLFSYGFSRTVASSANTTQLSTVQVTKPRVIASHHLSTFGFTISTMSYKEEIGIYFDASGTMEAFIDISEICEMEVKADGTESDTIKQPYSMRSTWRKTLAQCVLDDLLTGHPLFKKIECLLITDDNFLITFRNPDRSDGNYGRPNTFRRKMESIIKTNTMFRVAIKLQTDDVAALGLRPRDSLSPGSRFTPQTPVQVPGHPTPVPAMTPPVKAPNKLTIEPDLYERNFNIKTIPALSNMQDIQRWYNVLHARGRLCGVYTTPWEAVTKSSYMGTTWSLAFLDQAVMDREDSMSAALHGLLSAHEIIIGDCKELTHMITNSGGNGYLALYQIARLAHPLLGQVTAQKEQPQHRKSQSFAEHISYYLDYFQSEACSGRHYILNERVLLIPGRLHPTWRDVMKKKYMQLVPQNGIIPPIPLECHLEMLGVTLTQ